MTRTWTAFVSIAVLAAFACTVVAQRHMDALRHDTFHDELLSMPNEHLLGHFTAGMDSVIADVLWIKFIRYTSEHFKGDGKFTWLNHMAGMITRLDPYFVAAYRYGGMFLAALDANDSASIDLLKRGMARNPESWELPYEISMTYLLNRAADPASPVHAAQFLAMAVETGHAPQFVAETAVSLQSAHNLADVERRMWEATRANGDPFMRGLAERKLIEIGLRDACDRLDQAVSMYTQRFNRAPASLADLVTQRIIEAVPVDPLGGTFLLDSNGKAQNTTVLDSRVARLRNNLRTAVESYRRLKGIFPANLHGLVEERIMERLPAHPYADRSWRYDPATGAVE